MCLKKARSNAKCVGGISLGLAPPAPRAALHGQVSWAFKSSSGVSKASLACLPVSASTWQADGLGFQCESWSVLEDLTSNICSMLLLPQMAVPWINLWWVYTCHYREGVSPDWHVTSIQVLFKPTVAHKPNLSEGCNTLKYSPMLLWRWLKFCQLVNMIWIWQVFMHFPIGIGSASTVWYGTIHGTRNPQAPIVEGRRRTMY